MQIIIEPDGLPLPTFERGERVVVVDGSYRGCTGRYLRPDGVMKYGAKILLDDSRTVVVWADDLAAPTPTIPGDAALADDNAAAEQRAEWADYGDETVRTTWFYPTAPVMLCQGWRVVDERYHSEMCWDITWQRPCLLSADYA